MKLSDYRKKRDAARTNEPLGAEPPPGRGPTLVGAYVVHLHDATRRHYDLRIEVDGVLTSFAVPKGPTLDPDEKHVAIQTEDHPIEYLDFEAVIPAGNYGAGSMILWDRGSIRYLDSSAEAGLESGKLDFILSGHKLRGRFALVRFKGSKTEWLLLKKRDPHASKERDITALEPRSILSGLTVDELADSPRIAAAIEAQAAELGAPARRFDSRKLSPMLCSTPDADRIPTHGKGWIYELKLDGVRILAEKGGEDVTLTYRSARDTTASYPEVVRALRAVSASRVVLDGEIVAFDDAGQPNFQRLGQRIHLTRPADIRRASIAVPVLFMVFDMLAIGERDLRDLPLLERKRLLGRLLPGHGIVRALDHLEDDGRPLLAFCRDLRLEGVVAKRGSSRYRPGPKRYDDWVKIKCERDDDFVVVGWTRGERGRDRLGALDIASFHEGELVTRGKVGSGFDEKAIDQVLALLRPLVTPDCAVRGKLPSAPRGRTFVRPEIVVSVHYLGWSDEGLVRFPVFRGIRVDQAPTDCTAAPPGEIAMVAAPAAAPAEAKPAEAPAAGQDPRPGAGSGRSGSEERRAAITNKSKVLFPDDGYTKADLWAYYEGIAPTLLPYLEDRPIVLVRYPDGILGKHFFQWNAPPGMPSWVRSFSIHVEDEDRNEKRVFIVNDVDSLLFIANLACIPIHVLGCRKDTLDQCDFFTVDFDLKGVALRKAVTLALTLHELLQAIGLVGFPKTSGQSGLHVLVPLGPGVSFATARAMSEVLARLLVQRHPDLGTLERAVSKRGDRVYVDTGQTGPSRTIVSPYSVRATAGARVSTPLSWGEVTPDLDPSVFTIKTTVERVAQRGDPMAPLLHALPSVGAAVSALEVLVSESAAVSARGGR
jgi:bifunctional non-homologous end joining protein LigD